eukprot:TRINITY_DN6373_c0_g1_i1.p1 TRINITY_DN6373_c0_g1~~TRINITY_DN6373_c0_g1_i1.p1  ORF type:complete len:262 (+),score=26.38 TRINITY_DN6373_c0_g1_i1:658-1443(+)
MHDLKTSILAYLTTDTVTSTKFIATLSSALFFTLTTILIRNLGPKISPWYRQQDFHKRILFENRMCSILHLIPLLPWVMMELFWNDGDFREDRIFGDSQSLVFSFSCGYFLWDIGENIVFYHDAMAVIHGVVSFVLYSIVNKPLVHYYGLLFLLYELSTIFMNMMYVAKERRWGAKSSLVVQLSFAFSFFIVRIVFGLNWTSWVLQDLSEAIPNIKDPLDYFALNLIWGACFVFPMINFWWMGMILNVAYTKFFSKKTKVE